ncbi:MAG: tetraacyldisaccharide 4'-kinase, partial [Pseudomonadales bacterium]|nr:tetraacyldisaccharide 4'-kinase [Pseudomonadales bacterium]
GYRVAVLSKGYRSAHLRGAGKPRLVLCNDSSDEVGDEPLMLARALAAIEPTTPVVIGKQRNEGLAYLMQGAALAAERPIDVVLSDDGLQHYALPRDLEYVVIDGQRGFGNRCLLPAGPLREPVARLALADRIVINGAGEQAQDIAQACPVPRDNCASMQVSASTARLLGTTSEAGHDAPASSACGAQPLASLLAGLDTVIAITGTGNPARFFASITQNLGQANLVTAAFADHHVFVAADFTRVAKQHRLDASPGRIAFLVTEKDAVKCGAFASQVSLPVYVVGIEVELSSNALQPVLDACVQLQAWRTASASA